MSMLAMSMLIPTSTGRPWGKQHITGCDIATHFFVLNHNVVHRHGQQIMHRCSYSLLWICSQPCLVWLLTGGNNIRAHTHTHIHGTTPRGDDLPPKSGLNRMSYPFSKLSTVSFTYDMLLDSFTLREKCEFHSGSYQMWIRERERNKIHNGKEWIVRDWSSPLGIADHGHQHGQRQNPEASSVLDSPHS